MPQKDSNSARIRMETRFERAPAKKTETSLIGTRDGDANRARRIALAQLSHHRFLSPGVPFPLCFLNFSLLHMLPAPRKSRDKLLAHPSSALKLPNFSSTLPVWKRTERRCCTVSLALFFSFHTFLISYQMQIPLIIMFQKIES